MYTLTMDPSLRAFGWAVIKNSQPDSIEDCGCILSKKTNLKDKHVELSDRVSSIVVVLNDIIKKYKIKEAVFEVPIGSQSSAASKSLFIVQGSVIGCLMTNEVQFKFLLPRTIKKTLTGNWNAEKDDLLGLALKHFPEFEQIKSKLTKEKTFAISDAIAVYLAIKQLNL